jgi:multimeric flavodoxin WrbA
MKKVVVISSSLRPNSNSQKLAAEFARGAEAAGNEVEFISLQAKEIAFCRGCLACQKSGRCVIKDDVNEILAQVLAADVVAFASPVYYYTMSGQLKTLFDRMNGLYAAKPSFRDVYVLAVAAEAADSAFAGTIDGVCNWISCFEKAHLAGVLTGGGLTAPGDIDEKTELLRRAFELGQGV